MNFYSSHSPKGSQPFKLWRSSSHAVQLLYFHAFPFCLKSRCLRSNQVALMLWYNSVFFPLQAELQPLSQCQRLFQIPRKVVPQERWLINAIRPMTASIKVLISFELSSPVRVFGRERGQNGRNMTSWKQWNKRWWCLEEVQRNGGGKAMVGEWEIN